MPKRTSLKKISDLIADARNANKGTARGAEQLKRSLGEYGAGRSVLIDRKGRILAGNKTAEAAAALGFDKLIVVPTDGKTLVAVQRTDLDLIDPHLRRKTQELAIADNRISEINLEWDPEIIAEISKDCDLSPFFSETELAKLVGIKTDGSDGPDSQIDRAAELQKKWQTERGQLWQAGKHRLMCGDSSAADVNLLFGGSGKAWLLATDPPYGVDYGGSSGPDSAKRFAPMVGDEVTGPGLQKFLEQVFSCALPHLRSGAAWYLWHAQMTQGFFAAAAAAAQVKIHRQIIWAKSHFILGHGDFHWQHELCFYGWREGEKHRWFGDRSQSTVWEIDNPRAHENHPTEKPTECFSRPMILNTEPGDICYEPFSGSGSQLVAAEKTGRLCYAMEIDPGYVAVGLERLSEMGLKPKLAHRAAKKAS